MEDRDFQRLKESVQEMVDAESNTLTEQDAEKLEKVGFTIQHDIVVLPPYGSMSGDGRYLTDSTPIDDALIGVLVRMVQMRNLRTVVFVNESDHKTGIQHNPNRLWLYSNATPRQIFDALIEVLMKESRIERMLDLIADAASEDAELADQLLRAQGIDIEASTAKNLARVKELIRQHREATNEGE